MRHRTIVHSALAAVALAAACGASMRAGDPVVFKEARMFIEFNDTDQDVGVQIFLDGDDWRAVRIVSPHGKTIFDLDTKSGLKKQGLGELFFESAEPSLDEVSLAEFKQRFPEGEYRFIGRTLEGAVVRGTAEFTHAIPDGPVIDEPAEGAEVDAGNTVVSWQPVANPPGSQIVAYQVIVEQDLNVQPSREFSVHVPASVNSVSVPAEFMVAGADYTVEVLAIEAGGNQTITESEFSTAP